MWCVDMGAGAGAAKIFKMTWGWGQADGTVGRLEFCVWVGTGVMIEAETRESL